jgi:hypothetical protein
MKSDYEEICVLEDRDGVKARITKRRNPRGIDQLSVQFLRSYEQNGQMKETTWFSGRHLAGVARLIAEVDERLRLERERIVAWPD